MVPQYNQNIKQNEIREVIRDISINPKNNKIIYDRKCCILS